ncbi:hypothetical protein FQR65_LT05460 [Abscondita terminalis]|nr:hypothetical protein FQR65_LT05460 [Abscondita terminalis]
MNFNENSVKIRANKCQWFQWIPARVVMYLLASYIMVIVYVIRITINLTILAMVKEKSKSQSFNVAEIICPDNVENKYMETISYGGTLDWTVDQQYYVLTSFYWTYITSHFISGIITQKYGSKKVCGWSLVVLSLCNLCVPFTSYIHYTMVVIVQSIQGVAQGFIWPGLYAVVGIWIPIHERSRFVTCFQGSALGVMLANSMTGYIIGWFGWVYVFYISGCLGVLSALLWYLLMHNTPEQHPRISHQELQYIKQNREQSLHSENVIPWCSILTSRPVWAVAIVSFGRMWILSVFMIYGPLYYKSVGVTVEKNGLILGASSLIAFLSSLFFAFLSDKIVTYKAFPLVYNRKMFSVFGHLMTAVLALIIGFTVCNVSIVIPITYMMQAFLMANFVGSMSNVVDISPSYTGPVSSFIQIILLLPTILSTLVFKTLLKNENDLIAWKHTLYISCGVLITTAIFYGVFASGEVQPWDFAKTSDSSRDSNTKNRLLIDDRVKVTSTTPT